MSSDLAIVFSGLLIAAPLAAVAYHLHRIDKRFGLWTRAMFQSTESDASRQASVVHPRMPQEHQGEDGYVGSINMSQSMTLEELLQRLSRGENPLADMEQMAQSMAPEGTTSVMNPSGVNMTVEMRDAQGNVVPNLRQRNAATSNSNSFDDFVTRHMNPQS